jgi:hypothetical protein
MDVTVPGPLLLIRRSIVCPLKQKCEALNDFIRARNGWMVSVPGDAELRFEALPDSACRTSCAGSAPTSSRSAKASELPTAIVERFCCAPTVNLTYWPSNQPGRSRRL